MFLVRPGLILFKDDLLVLKELPPHDHHLIVLLILLIMAVSSTLLNEVGSPNYFYIFQVCNLSIYLFIGEHLKKYFKKRGLMMSILVIYVIIAFFVLKTGYNVPAVARDFRCTPVQYPLYLIMSVSGCVSMLQISMWINKNPVLESIGRGSLIVFILEFFSSSFYEYIQRVISRSWKLCLRTSSSSSFYDSNGRSFLFACELGSEQRISEVDLRKILRATQC